MDFENYTERSRGFVQAAQTIALRENHQQFVPEHLLKALLDDREGLAANLIRAAGGDPARALQATDAALGKLARVQGGQGQVYLGPETARVLESAQKLAEKAGDSFVTADRLVARPLPMARQVEDRKDPRSRTAGAGARWAWPRRSPTCARGTDR